LFNLLVIANETGQVRNLSSEITHKGYACSVTRNDENTLERVVRQAPNLVLIDMDSMPVSSKVWELTQRIKQERHIPVIALVSREVLNSSNYNLNIDDFVIKPWEASEVVARIKRILRRANNMGSEDVIKHGDLVIDTAKCQVSLGDRVITLTFKEYQLLKFLASNPGRVFSRETLLDKVWGWDYYGGDRTVDVHIRRLRSKIEDKNHSFIETVRSIGYRLREM